MCFFTKSSQYRYPPGIYLLKVNNKSTRIKCEICSKLTINTPERRHWRRSGVFIVKSEHISRLVLVFLLLTVNKQVNARRLTRYLISSCRDILACYRFVLLSLTMIIFCWSISFYGIAYSIEGGSTQRIWWASKCHPIFLHGKHRILYVKPFYNEPFQSGARTLQKYKIYFSIEILRNLH